MCDNFRNPSGGCLSRFCRVVHTKENGHIEQISSFILFFKIPSKPCGNRFQGDKTSKNLKNVKLHFEIVAASKKSEKIKIFRFSDSKDDFD